MTSIIGEGGGSVTNVDRSGRYGVGKGESCRLWMSTFQNFKACYFQGDFDSDVFRTRVLTTLLLTTISFP